MALDILITLIITSVIQSVFGVGVLLFGTPILLLLGYSFQEALVVLLPVSLTINIFQVIQGRMNIDLKFYKNILIFTIPPIILFLFIVTQKSIDINIIIGIFLLLVAAKSLSHYCDKIIRLLMKYEKSYFVSMGIIHGLTNLGGSLLTAIIHSKNYRKDITRVTTAVSYGTFAIFQIGTLIASQTVLHVQYSSIAIYMVTGIVIYLLTDKIVYSKINNERYHKIFGVFLLVIGILLIVKGFTT